MSLLRNELLQQVAMQNIAPRTLWLSGREYVVWCSGEYELSESREMAEDTAKRLAHKHQSDAFILAPIIKVAPKRDVEVSEIRL